MEFNGTVNQLFIDYEKIYVSLRREVLYNILTEFVILMKQVRLIRIAFMKKFKSRLNMGKCLLPLCSIFCLPISSLKALKFKIYKTIMLPVALYGCEIWSLALREEHGLRMFENGSS
jgi:hypothetical protein